MAGRAGRLSLVAQGRSILLADNSIERTRLFTHYVKGQPEPIKSSFDSDELDTWILRLLTQVKDVPRDAVVALLANTYAGYLATRASATWESQMRAEIEDLIRRMLELDLLEEEMGIVHLSLLGKACGKSHLKLRSVMRLIELLRRCANRGTLTAGALLALIHALPEFDEAYTPLFRKGQRETVWQRHVAQHYGRDITGALQRRAPDNWAYYARCKRVAVLHAWTDGMPISEIESTFRVTPFYSIGAGDIRSFADFARFHLTAAFEIADVLLLGQGPSAEEVEKLLAQLEVGIPADAIGLLDLPITLERGAYLALHQAGLVSPADVWSVGKERLSELVGKEMAATLQAIKPLTASAKTAAPAATAEEEGS
jgi:replicative superfamily II helicase